MTRKVDGKLTYMPVTSGNFKVSRLKVLTLSWDRDAEIHNWEHRMARFATLASSRCRFEQAPKLLILLINVYCKAGIWQTSKWLLVLLENSRLATGGSRRRKDPEIWVWGVRTGTVGIVGWISRLRLKFRIWRLEIWMGGSKYGPIREVEFKARGSAEEDEEWLAGRNRKGGSDGWTRGMRKLGRGEWIAREGVERKMEEGRRSEMNGWGLSQRCSRGIENELDGISDAYCCIEWEDGKRRRMISYCVDTYHFSYRMVKGYPCWWQQSLIYQ